MSHAHREVQYKYKGQFILMESGYYYAMPTKSTSSLSSSTRPTTSVTRHTSYLAVLTSVTIGSDKTL